MAAAAVVLGDELACRWIFDGTEQPITVEQISEFLASKAAVSAGERAYKYLCDWVTQNSNKLIDLVARPHLNLQNLSEIIPELKEVMESPANRQKEISEAAEIKMKYKGYIERERLIADKMHRLENIKIKGRFNYAELNEISTEGRQKLEHINPETLAQASRIPGVSPSDINVLLVLLGR